MIRVCGVPSLKNFEVIEARCAGGELMRLCVMHPFFPDVTLAMKSVVILGIGLSSTRPCDAGARLEQVQRR